MRFKEMTCASSQAGKLHRTVRLRLKHMLICVILIAFFSNPASADLVITQLANEGVMITDGETRILIDAMVVESYSIYGGLTPEAVPLFEQLSGPFSDIDLLLVSHRHHDHNQPRFACQFMQESVHTVLLASSQVLGLMREKCREFVTSSPRVQLVDPDYEQTYTMELEQGSISVFPLSHGSGKYARLQNHGHLIEIGGMSVLHIGDAAMNAADFIRAGLNEIEVDVALIPFWYFQPGPGSELVSQFMDASYKMAVHIPPGEMQEVEEYMAENFPRVIILSKPLDRALFSGVAQPLP